MGEKITSVEAPMRPSEAAVKAARYLRGLGYTPDDVLVIDQAADDKYAELIRLLEHMNKEVFFDKTGSWERIMAELKRLRGE